MPPKKKTMDKTPRKPETRTAKNQRVTVKTPPPDSPSDEEIGQAAYLRWLARGGEHGDHEKDWFEAEQELLRKKRSAQKPSQSPSPWRK